MNNLTQAQVRSLRELHTKKGREAQQAFFVEGEKGIAEALVSGLTLKRLLYTAAYHSQHQQLIDQLQVNSFDQQEVAPAVLEQLTQLVNGPEILAVMQLPSPAEENVYRLNKLVCFVDIADPGNLGTMIRTADWFGVEGIVVSSTGVDPYNEKVVRASMGSLFRLPPLISKNLETDLKKLKSFGYTVITAEAHGGQMPQKLHSPFCLLMGNEAHGIPAELQALSDCSYTIPGAQQAESLNVAVSFGIILSQMLT